MYWSPAQMLAHLTVNGASPAHRRPVRLGHVSGPSRDQRGSLLELTWGGPEPLTLADGDHPRASSRTATRSRSPAGRPAADGTRIALGEVTGTVVPGPA